MMQQQAGQRVYEPTWESLRSHPVPDWFHDAKFGIMVTWGPYSVPGWAPVTGDFPQVVAKEGWAAWFRKNPYAEWYLHTIQIDGSPTQEYHRRTYGPHFAYDDYVPLFKAAAASWNPHSWASLFSRVGARYVVFVTKHCDSFAMWPTSYPCPRKTGHCLDRDAVGELANAVRGAGMRMGLYYCSGMDWVFGAVPYKTAADMYLYMPQEPEYVAYTERHWRELIDRYAPSILWGDIGYPAKANLPELFAYYYNKVPDGVINDRFTQIGGLDKPLPRAFFRAVMATLAPLMMKLGGGAPGGKHCDFRTPEYTSYRKATTVKWESTRGIGHSFGYNRNEGEEDHISVEKLVQMLVDIVSKNGNLLLDVGPMDDGSIPDLQRDRLEGVGAWLAVYGEAIYGTRPWVLSEGRTASGLPLRFTRKGEALFVTMLGTPDGDTVVLEGLQAREGATVSLLGRDTPLSWEQEEGRLRVSWPGALPAAPAYALRITPAADPVKQ